MNRLIAPTIAVVRTLVSCVDGHLRAIGGEESGATLFTDTVNMMVTQEVPASFIFFFSFKTGVTDRVCFQ